MVLYKRDSHNNLKSDICPNLLSMDPSASATT